MHTELTKALFEVEALRTQLAAVEARLALAEGRQITAEGYKALFDIKALRAQLAAVEAERDTAEGRHITAEGYLATLMDERHALAAQNVRLREALKSVIRVYEKDNATMLTIGDLIDDEIDPALRLPLPNAAWVAEWREKAGLLDAIVNERISVSYRDGIPVTAHLWSAKTDHGFGTGNTLPEALAALCAAKGEVK